jgi:hypothetical protein
MTAGAAIALLSVCPPVVAEVQPDASSPPDPVAKSAAPAAASREESPAPAEAPSDAAAVSDGEHATNPAQDAGEAGASATHPGAAKEIPRDAFGPEDKALADRVEARWQALVERNFEAAYAYLLPSYRQTHTAEQYRSRFGNAVRWRVATVQGIRYDTPKVAHVSLNLETEHAPSWGGQAERLVTRLHETWLNRDDAWWLSVAK